MSSTIIEYLPLIYTIKHSSIRRQSRKALRNAGNSQYDNTSEHLNFCEIIQLLRVITSYSVVKFTKRKLHCYSKTLLQGFVESSSSNILNSRNLIQISTTINAQNCLDLNIQCRA